MTHNEARIVLLEAALDQSAHTIEFLHGCLTDDAFVYKYPEATQRQLRRIRELVPEKPGCVHGGYVEGCVACGGRLLLNELRREAEETMEEYYS